MVSGTFCSDSYTESVSVFVVAVDVYNSIFAEVNTIGIHVLVAIFVYLAKILKLTI